MTRIEKIKELLRDLSIDGFFINHIPNIRYLTGFSGSSASLLITKEKDYFLTDFRYKDQLAEQVKNFKIIITNNNDNEFSSIFDNENLKRIGYESSHMICNNLEKIRQSSPVVSFIPVVEKIEDLTIPKTESEFEKMKRAAEISDKTFTSLLDIIKPGLSELEISTEITCLHRKYGAQKDAFESIVASGWRGALPHGIASNKIIENGDMVTLDFGCVYDGYCCDITRTVAAGNPSEEMKKIYEIVFEAQQMAVDSAKANMSSKALDSVARDFITSKGYGKNFGHGLGHGVGIEVHELPRINQKEDLLLPLHAVITIEPGIYIENTGGVRIEDDVFLTETGCKVLNSSEKKLIIL